MLDPLIPRLIRYKLENLPFKFPVQIWTGESLMNRNLEVTPPMGTVSGGQRWSTCGAIVSLCLSFSHLIGFFLDPQCNLSLCHWHLHIYLNNTRFWFPIFAKGWSIRWWSVVPKLVYLGYTYILHNKISSLITICLNQKFFLDYYHYVWARPNTRWSC